MGRALAIAPEGTPRDLTVDERLVLADELRQLAQVLFDGEAPPADLAAVGRRLAAVADLLAPWGRYGRRT